METQWDRSSCSSDLATIHQDVLRDIDPGNVGMIDFETFFIYLFLYWLLFILLSGCALFHCCAMAVRVHADRFSFINNFCKHVPGVKSRSPNFLFSYFIHTVVTSLHWPLMQKSHIDRWVWVVVMSGSLCGVMVAHWSRIPEMWVQVRLQAQYFQFSSQPWHWCHDQDPGQTMVVEPTLYGC